MKSQGKRPSRPTATVKDRQKPVNLALQGGGAHGAFAWGVLDKLLEDGRLSIDAISATSAGAMNAVVVAYGNSIGGPDGAREKLNQFWEEISRVGTAYSPLLGAFLWQQWVQAIGIRLEFSPAFYAIRA
jgi:NTE family protein